MNDLFVADWSQVARTAIIGVTGYIGIVVLLRISGKRTLSKMNMFDFIVTIAFGSILATMLLSSDTSIVRGLTAVIVLIALQFAVTWTSVRSKTFSDIVKAEPRLLFSNGEYLEGAMREERVNKSELDAAMRNASIGVTSEVAAMVLETDGAISVIAKSETGDCDVVPPAKE
ncbi:DUF421 domain-containing protein [Hyphococcus sp.]|uniref:DUF421 domain-containing protein n=1 Tax=Hyphococcus sp. TaxID=2038636 RepID=UPI003CCBB2FE